MPHRTPRRLAAVAVAGALACAGCAGSPRAKPSATVDRWHPPQVTGPPSTSNFCTLLVADYRHVATLTAARGTAAKERIADDFANLMPRVIAEAPPSIAAAARTYLTDVATIVRAISEAGLNPSKVKSTEPAELIKSPQFRAAGQQLLTFSADDCHYVIGGA